MSGRLDEARAALDQHRAAAPPPTLLDALEDRDVAIGRVEANYKGELLEQIDRAVEHLAATVPAFTADDVREAIDVPDTLDLRVVGAALRRAARSGLIAHAGYTPSRYRHGSPVVRWRSEVVGS